jgi:hypothetical protein
VLAEPASGRAERGGAVSEGARVREGCHGDGGAPGWGVDDADLPDEVCPVGRGTPAALEVRPGQGAQAPALIRGDLSHEAEDRRRARVADGTG